MIVVRINQIVGYWIRSTAERLIAANAAGIIKIDCSPLTRSCVKSEQERQENDPD